MLGFPRIQSAPADRVPSPRDCPNPWADRDRDRGRSLDRHPSASLAFTALVGLVELLPVPAWRGLQLGVGLPLMLMIGMLHPPAAAGAAALVGASDPRELRRQVTLGQAVFNRCQVALSVLAASWCFHSVVVDIHDSPARLVFGAMLASIVDYVINSGIVTIFMSIKLGLSPRALRVSSGLGVCGSSSSVTWGSVFSDWPWR